MFERAEARIGFSTKSFVCEVDVSNLASDGSNRAKTTSSDIVDNAQRKGGGKEWRKVDICGEII